MNKIAAVAVACLSILAVTEHRTESADGPYERGKEVAAFAARCGQDHGTGLLTPCIGYSPSLDALVQPSPGSAVILSIPIKQSGYYSVDATVVESTTGDGPNSCWIWKASAPINQGIYGVSQISGVPDPWSTVAIAEVLSVNGGDTINLSCGAWALTDTVVVYGSLRALEVTSLNGKTFQGNE